MHFITYASSSAGNAYEIVAKNGRRLLIEAGLPWAKMLKVLAYNLRSVEGCLCSHFHGDHSRAIKQVMRNGINTYASLGTWLDLNIDPGPLHRAKVVSAKKITELPSFKVLPFDVVHNVTEALGFVVYERETQEYLLFATDAACIRAVFPFPFSIVCLAVNYDPVLLRLNVDAGYLHESVGRRLLDSHATTNSIKQYIKESLNLNECREFHVLHCSHGNLDRAQAYREIKAALDDACPFSDIKVI